MTGTIVALYPCGDGSGYGFIETADGERVYFNASGLQMSSVTFAHLEVGDLATRFTVIDHPKGPRAIEVHISDKNQQGLPL